MPLSKPTLLLICLNLILILMCGFIFFSNYFKISVINCFLDGNTCPNQLTEYLNRYLHTFAPFLKVSAIDREVYRQITTAQTVKSSLTKPQELTVKITQAVPFANLQSTLGSKTASISQNGRLLGYLDNPVESLPTIMTSETLPAAGEQLSNQSLLAAIELLYRLNLARIAVAGISIIKSDLFQCNLTNNLIILFSGLKDITSQVTALQQVLPAATMNSPSPIIDVRLDKPVLKPAR